MEKFILYLTGYKEAIDTILDMAIDRYNYEDEEEFEEDCDCEESEDMSKIYHINLETDDEEIAMKVQAFIEKLDKEKEEE